MNKFYQRGRRAEYEAKELLEKDGWEVFRCAGSHGRADLCAVKWVDQERGWMAKLVQVKSCHEKDIKKYEKAKIPNFELWIKIIGHGWKVID